MPWLIPLGHGRVVGAVELINRQLSMSCGSLHNRTCAQGAKCPYLKCMMGSPSCVYGCLRKREGISDGYRYHTTKALSYALTMRMFYADGVVALQAVQIFQPIHLGGTFTDTPCKLHNRSLRAPRATALTPTPAFKNGTRSFSPTCLYFVVYASVRESRSLYHVFWFYDPTPQCKTNEDGNPNFSTTPRQFSMDFGIDDGF
ncbi:hypothetical protein AVEN_19559-1 [Araneus ventricosus]|uniref:Uncharacterized protein n=1 Tax=Araneus ventricosus TaxID=182803 RepID=A0A4Y2R121_ARAVE|nr:hypothetical protein AVEN_19559-1 [Araneus ventricosus]